MSDPRPARSRRAVDREANDGRLLVAVPGMRDRDVVRRVTARVLDVPGVVAVEADPDIGALWVDGEVAADAVEVAIRAAGFAVSRSRAADREST